MTHVEIKSVLEAHQKWQSNPKTGRRADLRGADLKDADLRRALNLAQTTCDRLDNVARETLFNFLDPEIVSEDSGAYFDLNSAARYVSRKRMADFLKKECR